MKFLSYVRRYFHESILLIQKVLFTLFNGPADFLFIRMFKMRRQKTNLTQRHLIASDVQTTLQRTIAPGATPSMALNLWEVSKYSQYGYGNWTYGSGLPYDKRLDIMPATYSGSAVTKKTKLLNFFTISDIHITDKESPNQLIYLQRLHPTLPVGASLYSGIMLYTTHVLNADVQTVNALHKQIPFYFVLSLCVTSNTTQYNVLRWY